MVGRQPAICDCQTTIPEEGHIRGLRGPLVGHPCFKNISGVVSAFADLLQVHIPTSYEVSSAPDSASVILMNGHSMHSNMDYRHQLLRHRSRPGIIPPARLIGPYAMKAHHLPFMPNNGMFQRLDKLRKTGFASVILFGTNNDSTISGIWVFRGQDLAFTLSEDWQIDYESYTWRKLDSESEECKTLVKEYFCWEGDFKHVGKAFNQGKIFK